MGARWRLGVGHDRRRGCAVRPGRRRPGRGAPPGRSPGGCATPCAAGGVPRWPSPAGRRRRRCSPRSAAMDLPWDAIDIWQVDERVAPDGDPDRNAGQLAGVPGHHHLMPVTAPDLRAAAADVRRRRSRTASTSCTSAWAPTATPRRGRPATRSSTAPHPVDLSGEYQGRVRMTLTPPVVDAARGRVVLITGADKAAPSRPGSRAAPRPRSSRSPGSGGPTRSSCSTRTRRPGWPRRAPDEARRRLLDGVPGRCGRRRRPDAPTAQRRGPMGDRRALRDRAAGADRRVHRRPRQPVPAHRRAGRDR